MTIEQNLERLNLLNAKIKDKIDDLNRLRQRSTTIGSFDFSKDKVQTSPPNDAPYTSIVAMITEKEDEIEELLSERDDLQKEIDPQIYAILSHDEYRIISMRLYRKMDWHKIANAFNCSESTIHRKYNEAIHTIKSQDIDFNE